MVRYWVHSAPDDIDDSQRECARAERCSDARVDLVDGKTVRLPALTYRAFCDVDRNHIEKALRDMPGYQRRVHAEIGSKSQAVGPVVSTSKSAPLPINLSVDELLCDMQAIIISWHERVAAVARLAAPDGHVSTACRVLAAHVDVLLALPEEPMGRSVSLHEAAKLPTGTVGLVHKTAAYADVILHLDGARAGLEVLNLTHRSRRLLGETKPQPRHLSGVACGSCGFTELRELLDDDSQPSGAKCWECRNEYDMDGYRDLVSFRVDPVKTYRRAGVQKMYDGEGSGRA